MTTKYKNLREEAQAKEAERTADVFASETAFAEAFRRSLRLLLESKALYQNVDIDSTEITSLKTAGILEELKKRMLYLTASQRIGPKNFGRYSEPSSPMPPGHGPVQVGLPSINIPCKKCGRSTTFVSLERSFDPHGGDTGSVIGGETEQLLNLVYRCAECPTIIGFQVVRRAFKFQLTGRSKPFEPNIQTEWPQGVRKIIRSARRAAFQNDLPAAYFHLRTAMEHFMKGAIGMDVSEQMTGDELCREYNRSCDPRLVRDQLPALLPMYSELSAGMHAWSADWDGYQKYEQGFFDHVRLRGIYGKYPSREGPGDDTATDRPATS